MIFLWTNSADLNRARQFYTENGYAIFSQVMPPDICDWVNESYRKIADKDFAPILNYDRENLDIQTVVMKNHIVVDIIEHLTGSAMVGCQTYFLFKEPGTRYAAQEFECHQDNSYPRSEPGAYLAVDISLCDQDKESGGICLWPGTHKLGLLPFEEKTGYREKEGERPGNKVVLPDDVALAEYEGMTFAVVKNTPYRAVYNKIDATLNKGDALIFDGDTIHASYPNKSDHGRPAIITNYLREGAEMIAGRTAKRMRIPLR